MSEGINIEKLGFSAEKQRAVLGHVLYDERFFKTVILRVEPQWFQDDIVAKIYGAAKNWWSKYGRPPTVEELQESRDLLKLGNAELNQVRGVITNSKETRKVFTAEPLFEEMEAWMKTRLIQINMPKVAIAFNKQDIDGSMGLLNDMIKDYHEIKFFEDGVEKFSTLRNELLGEVAKGVKSVSFGVEGVDKLLDQHKTGMGGLLPGDMTLLLAPTNVGKTSTMVTIAAANVKQGKSVLFVTHEGTPVEIKSKFMRCITGMGQDQLVKNYMDADAYLALQGWEKILDSNVVYLPINRPGITIEEVIIAIQAQCEDRRLKTGKGFDLIVDDYPAKLGVEGASKRGLQTRHVLDEVYNQFVQIALEQDAHVLVAIQSNREGSRINRHVGAQKYETRLLVPEDVAEAFGPCQAAATIISLNRDDTDAQKNRITFLICKSRSGETGWAVVCKTDYNSCRTHSNDLGWFSYRGQDSLGDASTALMDGYKGQVVSSDKIQNYKNAG